MSQNTYELIFFNAVLATIYCVLFIFLGTRMIKSGGNRISAAIVCLCLTLLIITPLFKRPDVLEFLQERIALYCLGLVVATVSIVALFHKS